MLSLRTPLFKYTRRNKLLSFDRWQCRNGSSSHLSREAFGGDLDATLRVYGCGENTIVILCANHIDQIDPACLRPGRIDHRFHLGELNDDAIRRYLREAFPDASLNLPSKAFAPITGAELYEKYRADWDNPTRVIDGIAVA